MVARLPSWKKEEVRFLHISTQPSLQGVIRRVGSMGEQRSVKPPLRNRGFDSLTRHVFYQRAIYRWFMASWSKWLSHLTLTEEIARSNRAEVTTPKDIRDISYDHNMKYLFSSALFPKRDNIKRRMAPNHIDSTICKPS